MNRTFLLPLSALALGATAHAEEPTTSSDRAEPTEANTESERNIVGEWTATSLADFADQTYTMPFVSLDTYRRVSYVETWSMALNVGVDSVALTSTYEYANTRDDVTDTSVARLTYSGAWNEVSAAVHTIAFRSGDLNMDCTLAGDALDCTGTADSPQHRSISFVRDVTNQ